VGEQPLRLKHSLGASADVLQRDATDVDQVPRRALVADGRAQLQAFPAKLDGLLGGTVEVERVREVREPVEGTELRHRAQPSARVVRHLFCTSSTPRCSRGPAR
jgi:hypothetical protein